jgi:N-ethylmaleimide reductase
MPSLFDPIQFGAITAPNRLLMAPLTRGRATADHVPTDLMIEYYRQRAGAGLIISEATGISAEGLGWPYAPGIWNDEQVAAWQKVTKVVHDAGGRIVLQLWHMGRIVHSNVTKLQPVSSSPTTGPGEAHTYDGKKPFEQARALDTAEIPRVVADYVHAARNAIAAGFDGVQIHAANGYLIDQFLRDNSNFRTDGYGGPIENRVRLLREVAAAVVGAIGGDRVGVRLSPNGDTQGVNDSAPHDLFPAAAAALSEVGVTWLELREPGPDGTFGKGEVAPVAPLIRKAFGGALVLNSDYDKQKAQAALDAGEADAIAFGRPYIANPDLPVRYRLDLPLQADTMATWYSRGATGYTDYPTHGAATPAT